MGYLKLLHLRARWYAPGTGTFLSRDPVESEPPYQYVRGNVVNRVDPSGYSPCPSGLPCGPDVTEWFMKEIDNHVNYGYQVSIKSNMIFSYMALNMPWYGASGGPTLGESVRETGVGEPFTRIINALNLANYKGLASVDYLALVEYGMYGLAVNYSDVDFWDRGKYPRVGTSCGNDFCDLGRDPSVDNRHKSVTFCGHCIDATDLGNIMFGVGGYTRGYSRGKVFALAQTFNLVNDVLDQWQAGNGLSNPINPDPRASPAGYDVAMTRAYLNRTAFCTMMGLANYAYFGIHEDAENAARCPTCSDYLSPNSSHAPPSSYLRVSALGDENVPGARYPIRWFRDSFHSKVEPYLQLLLDN